MRLIDLMCDRHRDLILITRIWPEGYIAGNHNPGNNSCYDCGEVGRRQPTGKASLFPNLDDDETAAIHEAGHVVVVAAAGFTPLSAALESSNREGSTAHFTASVPADMLSSVERFAITHGGVSGLWHWLRREGAADAANLIDAVNSGCLDFRDLDGTAWQGDARPQVLADRLVAENWPAVERVADALLSRGRLDGAEIAAIARIGAAA